MKLADELEEILDHELNCSLTRGNDRCDCNISSLLSLFKRTMEEVIGSHEITETFEQKILDRNKLRTEQRKRLEQMFCKHPNETFSDPPGNVGSAYVCPDCGNVEENFKKK